MQTKYSKSFKIEAVKKTFLRDSETSISSVARSLDIKISTLHGWIKSMENKNLKEESSFPTSGEKNEKSPYHWTIKERFEIVIKASTLPQEELAAYCRKKGLFPYHLEKWKADFINSSVEGQSKEMGEKKKLKNEIKSLTIELRRKEKALAEAAALLILKKKATDLFWGNEGL